MSSRTERVRRLDPDERAGLRLTLLTVGAALLALVLGPVALLVHASWGPLVRLDTRTSAAAEGLDSTRPSLVRAAEVLTHLGDPVGLTVASAVLALLLLRRGRPRIALFLVMLRVGTLLLSQITKAAVGRARPRFADPVAEAFGASIPYGHALGATAVWSGLALNALPLVARRARPWVLAAGVAVPLVVCATRVLLGVHYLSDVTAGFVLGLAWTAVCAAVLTLWRAEEGRSTAPLTEGIEPELGSTR